MMFFDKTDDTTQFIFQQRIDRLREFNKYVVI